MNEKDQIRALVQKNQLADAKSLCITICNKHPDDAEAWFLYGMLNGILKDFSGASRCYDEVIRLMPQLVAAYYNKGVALQALNNHEEALKAFEKVIQLDPSFENINCLIADTYYNAGNPVSAEEYYKIALNNKPNDTVVHYKLGSAHMKNTKYHEAETCFRKVISLKPDHAEATFSLASSLQLQGKLKESEQLYKRAIEIRPDYHLAYNGLGILYKEMDQLDNAIECFNKAIRYNPGYVDAYSNLGHACQILGKYDQALLACKKASELNPQNPELLYGAGLQYEKLGKYDDARNYYSQALSLDNKNIRYPYVIARSFALEKKYDEAIEYYNKVIDSDSTFADGYCSLGKVYLDKGDTEKATEYFRKTISVQPGHITASYYLSELDPEHVKGDSQHLFIEQLFDGYADTFEQDLVNKLGYRTPQLMHDEVINYLNQVSDLVIFDLGCGTGLCGELFRKYARRLVGVDLSSRIIEKARAKNIYDALHVAELTTVLNNESNSIDLLLAADVFVYVGDLKPIFALGRQVLRSAGILCFSVEHKEGQSYAIQGNGRYSHSVDYIRKLADSAGLQVVSHRASVIRKEYGADVQGDIYVLQRCQ